MDAAPSPAPPQPPPGNGAWPRSAQLAAAFLLGGAIVLLAVHAYGHLRWGSRPTELAPAHRIDLNRASRAELLQLPDVGPTLAERIEAYRRDNGGFRSVDELQRVNGIGPAKMAKLRPWVCVEDAADEDEPDGPAIPVNQSDAAAKGKPAQTATKKPVPAEPLDLNTATVAQLKATLPDIGPKKAQAIVDEREKGPFKSVDDLRRVHGIGQKTIDKLRPYVTVRDESHRVAARE
jgi:competence protein ComEA